MRIRNLDSNDDWCFGQGVGSYATQEAAIDLNIKTRIRSWLNDCFFAQTAGIDWYNRLSYNQQVLLDLDLRRTILQSYGVTGIITLDFELSSQTRTFNATYTITTIYKGVITSSITGILGGNALLSEDGQELETEDGQIIDLE